MSPREHLDNLYECRRALEAAERGFLDSMGWRYRTDEVGSYWLWHSPAASYRCETSMAILLAIATLEKAALAG